jgi:di/tricarboxylate transporter
MLEWEAALALTIALGSIAILATTRLSPDMVLMAGLIILHAAGVLTVAEALAGFANPGLLTVAALFVVAAGVRASGGIDLLVDHVLGQPKSQTGSLVRLTLPVAGMSGALNNTPIVAAMIPAVNRWSKRINVPAHRLLIPLSYASILGGTLTLIGTSTNLVVNGQFQVMTGSAGFGMFDITRVGLPVAIIGLVYLIWILPRLLPDRPDPAAAFGSPKRFTMEVAVAHDSPLEGKTIAEAGLRGLRQAYLAEIERAGSIITAVSTEERLRGGDRLVFVGDTDAIVALLRINGLVPSDNEEPVLSRQYPERKLIEAVVSPYCDRVGQTIRDGRFRDRYGAVVLAVAREGRPLRGNLASIQLRAGDLLLLEARPAFVTRQRAQNDFLLINELDEERPDHRRAKLSWAILLGVVLAAAIGVTTILTAALIGAAAIVATRCLAPNEARRSIDLGVYITIAASFGLGTALYKSGAAEFIAVHALGLANNDPLLLLIMTYVFVSLATEVVTNNAAAVLSLPIVLATTASLGLNPEPYVITVMMAASASFATPLGYQTNLMVYGPGSYRFTDFLRAGVPMNVIAAVVTIAAVALQWPLR